MNITVAQPRDTVRVTLPNNVVLEGALNTTIGAFFDHHRNLQPEQYDSTVIAGILDGKLRELTYRVARDGDLRPVLLSSSDGGRIYRRSLVLLLTTAIDELWPGCRVNVRYAVPEGGFYCVLLNRDPFTADELAQLEAHMRAIVAADEPITKRTAPLTDVTALYAERGEDDKVRLLEQRTRSELTMYKLRGREDYYYGYMTASTGALNIFRLLLTDDKGFILQYPRKEAPTRLPPIAYGKLTGVFHKTDEWLRLMQVEDIGQLNRLVRSNRVYEIMLVAEALHEQEIARIAGSITEQYRTRGARLVLIAGPSSSGKTTFAKRLGIQLLAHGVRPFTLEMDNYFVERERTPRDESGEYDFEALGALDRDLFNAHLLQLMNGAEVQLPRFNFHSGKRELGNIAQLHTNQVIIIEGIHGLNPALVPAIPSEAIYRVYASALSPLNLDSHNRMSTTDLRLLRRIVRDALTRGYNAAATLSRWASVRRGERRNIFPYQENADAIFNSALVYELAALRPLVEPLILQVEVGTPEHIEANRLLSFLRWVQPFTPEQQALTPETSLLREFIGGSNILMYQLEGEDR